MKVFICLTMVFFCFTSSIFAKDKAQTFTFGVLNQTSNEETKERWQPILDHLFKKTQIKLVLLQGKDAEETDKMMAQNKFDFIYTNHHLHDQYNSLKLKTLVKFRDSDITGDVITKNNSAIQKIEDLTGKKIGYPTNSALVAYYVNKVKLFQLKVPHKEVFLGDQDKTLKALIDGEVDAVGINSSFVKKYEDAHKDQAPFKRLYTSESFSGLPIVYYPKVPKDIVTRVKKAILLLDLDEDLKPVLLKLKIKGFVEASDAEYENARKVYKLIDNDL